MYIHRKANGVVAFQKYFVEQTLQPTYYEIWFNILITSFALDRRNKNMLTWLEVF